MVQKSVILATLLICCLTQAVLSLGTLTPAAAFRANMQQRERYPNALFYVNDVLNRQDADDIKDPIIKRFKPCYYSPIQCLIKK